MKCTHCRLCLITIRVDKENYSKIYWYCDLCQRVYAINMGKKEEIEDKEITDSVKENYKKMRFRSD